MKGREGVMERFRGRLDRFRERFREREGEGGRGCLIKSKKAHVTHETGVDEDRNKALEDENAHGVHAAGVCACVRAWVWVREWESE